MKNLRIFSFLAVLAIVASSNGCKKANPEPQNECIEGVVIAQGRTAPDEFSCATVVQIINKNIGETWGYNNMSNCVYITNLTKEMSIKGSRVYFTAYQKIADTLVWTADCAPPPSFHIKAENLSIVCTQEKK